MVDCRTASGLGRRTCSVLPTRAVLDASMPPSATICSRNSSTSASTGRFRILLGTMVDGAVSEGGPSGRAPCHGESASPRNCPRPGSHRSCARCRPRTSTCTRQALSVARAVPVRQLAAAELTTVLLRIAGDGSAPLDLRLEALAAVPGGLASVDSNTFDALRSGLEPDAAGSRYERPRRASSKRPS